MDVSKLPNHHPVPWNTTFEPMALPAMFARSTRAAPDAPLLHFLGRSYTYDELFRDAQAFAQALIRRGIAAGDRVGLFLPNVPSYVVAYYGAMMAGAVVVNFSPLYSVEEL
ncbi:MAG: AMP-binding protein, partial [Pseudomonadota bacterium]|nr:AMP-binding protein [Pseudomonadota bacterium]